ncbi:MAG: DUF4229 domain-containing protein [Nocardioides sp.]
MKEFWIYTGLRIAVFVASLGVVAGVWMLVADEVPVLWVIVLAFILSGVASYVLLARPREALARHVEERAGRAASAFEAQRSKEDTD